MFRLAGRWFATGPNPVKVPGIGYAAFATNADARTMNNADNALMMTA